MRVDVITLFPGMISGYLSESMLGRAQKAELLQVVIHDLRKWGVGPHKQVDDRPFGGGAGMVLMAEPLFAAVEELKGESTKVVYMSPDGKPLSHDLAQESAAYEHLIIISGHYEGIDERIRTEIVDFEVSIGDYVLTNGTLPAAVYIDAMARYIPGVLGEEKSLTRESFRDNLLSFPQYTRPENFRGLGVPEVLLSGNHKAIDQWRQEQQIIRTKQRRPDILTKDEGNESAN